MIETIAMQILPPIPSWSELHPLVIHFPIALLLAAPLFIIGAVLLDPKKGRPFLIAALVLMILGTAGTFLAVATGEAAGEVAEKTASMSAVLERHEDLAQTTRVIFSGLTIIFASILLLPRLLKRESTLPVTRILSVAFLLLYGAGTVVLVNTAHNGGRLVHEYGVRGTLGPIHADGSAPASNGAEAQETKSDH